MPSDVTVMMESHYLLSDVGSRRNIDFTAEVQHSVRFRPLRRANEAGGSGLQCLDCLFHSIFQFLAFHLSSDELEQTYHFQSFQGKNRKEVWSEEGKITIIFRAIPVVSSPT
jgi:hypothetical protein